MIVPWNYLVCMGITDNATNNFDSNTVITVLIEYLNTLQNTPIFSNLHRLG
jgi:hypothetical protein